MENAAQMMTVSELYIYWSLNKESPGILCYRACLCIIFTHCGTKNKQIQVKAKLVEYKYENKLIY